MRARYVDPGSDAADEERRLLAEEKAERGPEEEGDSPLVRYCRANPREAASQIEALQWAVRSYAVDWHLKYAIRFEDCTNTTCRKLRDRLRPVGDAR